ncbi:MAG: efflux RND transporter permease subunit [Candidatus Bipolaricaulota bacterium]
MNRIFRFSVEHPWWALALSILVSAAFLVPALSLEEETDFREFLSKDDPIIRAMDEAEARYGRTFGVLVMVRNPNGVVNVETLGRIERVAREIEAIPGVRSVQTPLNSQVITGTESGLSVGYAAPGKRAPGTADELEAFRARLSASRLLEGHVVSADGQAASINIELDVGADEYAITPQILDIVHSEEGGDDEFFFYGDAYFDALMSEEMQSDLQLLFPLALGTMVVVLFLSFFRLRGVVLPIAVVLLSVAVMMGCMGLLGFPMTMVSFIAPVLLLAIGIADGIHILTRYNEELGKGTAKKEAILATMHEMKGPVVMTSLTTAAGFLSLLSSFFLPQKQFGIVASLGVLAAMFLSLFFFPATLSVLGVPRRRRTSSAPDRIGGVLLAFERLIMRRRRLVLVVAAAIVVAMVAGLPMLRIETSNEEFLGKDHPAIQILEFVDEHFSGAMQIQVEIDTGRRDGLKDPAVLQQMVALEGFLRTRGVTKTMSLTDLVREMNEKFHAEDASYYAIPSDSRLVSQLLLLFTFQGGDLGDMALGDFSAGTILGLYPMQSSRDVSKLARDVQSYLDANFADGVRARMVGATVLMDRMMTRMTQSQLVGLATTSAAVAVLVMLLMGSMIAGLIAAIPLLLTVVVSMGWMAYTGTPLDVMTLMVSAIAVGIGVDYSIHFIARFRLEMRKDGDGERALAETIRSSGRGIVTNALTVSLGFFLLVFASFKGVRMFGLQIALAMLLSAVSAISLIPAILLEWKPAFLLRRPWAPADRR